MQSDNVNKASDQLVLALKNASNNKMLMMKVFGLLLLFFIVLPTPF